MNISKRTRAESKMIIINSLLLSGVVCAIDNIVFSDNDLDDSWPEDGRVSDIMKSAWAASLNFLEGVCARVL